MRAAELAPWAGDQNHIITEEGPMRRRISPRFSMPSLLKHQRLSPSVGFQRSPQERPRGDEGADEQGRAKNAGNKRAILKAIVNNPLLNKQRHEYHFLEGQRAHKYQVIGCKPLGDGLGVTLNIDGLCLR